ncbi:hypothetical protein BN1708_015633 [Verticillium longisporum]|uniref:Uncharacterized protein n=1 Tax=Verticillium longisporum TaxID=100787 RepID=A0A0G4M5Y2_VERLO|nr:hypothetical protein BN1708_015633 [Verticillium longisporum]
MEAKHRAAKARRRRKRDERERQAEDLSREAARKAREQHELAVKARLRREKEREAEERSAEVARRNRVERERVAQGRLKNTLIKEKQDTVRHNWAIMREAAEPQEAGRPLLQPAASRSPECPYPQFGWHKMNGNGLSTARSALWQLAQSASLSIVYTSQQMFATSISWAQESEDQVQNTRVSSIVLGVNLKVKVHEPCEPIAYAY